ncbi:DUF1488 family protein [Noviherbaspirillum sp. Root189]|uniref:DUF1488 family protein n=1 Tax=Noviherbaspirillum sp. Root189 TaxID=1736487 RepID=UPI000709B82F|nr:DUF1488 family protein [Noviherbaspirillum sp. Root189]KRB69811.1 hypothetical protein ASE07_27375 [Noviherbaspirillum sp. Root189]
MEASQPRATSEGILFTVQADSKVEQCLISQDALRSLSLLKNIDPADASALEIFQAFEGFIHPVAQALLKRATTAGLVRLTKENINDAYGPGPHI